MAPPFVNMRELVQRLIMAELLARRGEGPLARRGFVAVKARADLAGAAREAPNTDAETGREE